MSVVELKKALKEKPLTIGNNKTLKNIRNGKVKKVFLASNCPQKMADTINRYAKISKFSVVSLKINSDEVAAICKKQFNISVLSY